MKTPRVQIHPRKIGDIWKHADAWLAEALGARWTHRHGYTVASPARAALFERLRAAGVEPVTCRVCATNHRFHRFIHPAHPGATFTLSEISKLVP